MKRLATALILTAALLVGSVTVGAPEVAAAPDRPEVVTDYVSSTTTRNICAWGGAIYLGNAWILALNGSRTIHYLTAHITQCWFYSAFSFDYQTCLRYVWGYGIATPYWQKYYPPCW